MAEPRLLDRLRPGDHVCLIADDDPVRTRNVAAYVRNGLRDQHRVIYQGQGGAKVEAVLIAQGVDVDTARRRGQLRIAQSGSAYLRGGRFDPEATLASWRSEADQARAAGYHGLRAVGDMSWASLPMTGTDRLPWYEAQVNRLFAEGFAMGVCLYDQRLFSAQQLRKVTGSHLCTMSRGTDPGTIPLLRVVRTADPAGLRLEGEADLSNRRALQTVTEHLIEDTAMARGTLTVDVTELRFADVAAVRILLRLVGGGRHRLRLVGCSRMLRRLIGFEGGPHPAVEFA